MKSKLWIVSIMFIFNFAACQPIYVRMSNPEPFEPLATEWSEIPDPIDYLPHPFIDIQPQQIIEYSLVNPETPGYCRYESCGVRVVMSGEESGLMNYEIEKRQDVFVYLIDHLVLTINNQKLPSNFPTGCGVEYNEKNQITSIRFEWHVTLIPGVHQFDLKYTAPSGAESEVSWRLVVIDDWKE